VAYLHTERAQVKHVERERYWVAFVVLRNSKLSDPHTPVRLIRILRLIWILRRDPDRRIVGGVDGGRGRLSVVIVRASGSLVIGANRRPTALMRSSIPKATATRASVLKCSMPTLPGATTRPSA
jgi:hypothetical protein